MRELTRILIVAHSEALRATLARFLALLDRSYAVIGEAATAQAAIGEAARLQPDVIVLDLDLPDRGGVQTTREIHAHWAQIAIIAVTDHEHREYARAALAAGARECVRKVELVEKLPAVLSACGEIAVARPWMSGRNNAPVDPRWTEQRRLGDDA